MAIPHCPNPECEYAKGGSARFFHRHGHFVTKWNAQPVSRYRCRGCRRSFSTHTFRKTYRQKKPFLNEPIFLWYASATTQRRIARVMQINRKTVVRKFLFMAGLAKTAQERAVWQAPLQTTTFQFDEMESFEHTRLKPLSIAVLLCGTTRKLLDIRVGSMPMRGVLSGVAIKKYGDRKDERPKLREAVFRKLGAALNRPCTMTTDSHLAYPRLIKTFLPKARHLAVIRPKIPKRLGLPRPNPDDPLFAINHTAAKIRHDLSRMARKVWVTTKKAERLQLHLDLYVAFHNGYSLKTA